MIRKAITAVAVGAAVIVGAGPAAADTSVDIEAWAQQHKSEIKFFVGVDVNQCEGLKGLTYEGAVSMADARSIDLDSLVKKTDADEILNYVDSHGITLAQLRSLIDDFCEGEIPVPSVKPTTGDTDPGTPSGEPSGSTSGGPSATPSGSGDGSTPSPSASTDDPEGSMANTGGMSPWVPIGVSSGLIGSGLGLFALRRKGIL
jgi:hypothetical protein